MVARGHPTHVLVVFVAIPLPRVVLVPLCLHMLREGRERSADERRAFTVQIPWARDPHPARVRHHRDDPEKSNGTVSTLFFIKSSLWR